MHSHARADARTAPVKLTVLFGALLAALVAIGLLAASDGRAAKDKGEKVRVMTRNIYLGADLTPALEAQNPNQVRKATADILEEVQRTNFPERAKLLAKEIKKSRADLVGLQEVALWRLDITDPDGDLGPPVAPNGTPAETVLLDFLDILRQELKAVGARYKLVHVQQEFDVEMFIEDREGDPHEDPGDDDFDGRLTMRDVILAKKGDGVRAKKSTAKGGHYENLYTAEISGFPIPVQRGWQSVKAKVRGERFLFVNTHLEAFDEGDIRAAQAQELVSGPAKSKKDVVLLGDFNTGNLKRHKIGTQQEGGTAGDEEDRQAWNVIRQGGFFERQTRDQSCCFDSELDASSGSLDHTVDHITVNNKKIKKGKSQITGDTKLTPSGLRPSDHGGVWSKLIFR